MLSPIMVTPEYKKIEHYIWGLRPEIQGNVTSSEPTTIQGDMLGLYHYATSENFITTVLAWSNVETTRRSVTRQEIAGPLPRQRIRGFWEQALNVEKKGISRMTCPKLNNHNEGRSHELRECLQNYTAFKAYSIKDTIIGDMDFIKKYMLETILHQQEIQKLLTEKKLLQTQEVQSNIVQAFKANSIVMENTCSEKENSNSEPTFNKSVKENSLDSEIKNVREIKYKMSKAKERCMAYFRSIHSHLQVLSKEDLKGTHIEHGFKRAFMSLFGQDDDTFTSTMFIHVDQLQEQLDNDEFQEERSMAAFWVINRQFQKFINSQFTLDYDSQITEKYFVEYTEIEYERRVNKRPMQTQKGKVDLGKALDASLVVIESNRIKSEVQDESRRSGNDTNTDDEDIRPIYDEEPMAEVQLTTKFNIFATGQQHIEQPKIIDEGRVDQYTEKCQVKSPMLDSSLDNKTTEFFSNQSLMSKNISLKKTGAQFQKDFSRMEAQCIALELKYQNQSSKSGQHGQVSKVKSKEAKIKHDIDVPIGKIFTSCTRKADSESTHGFDADISKIHECKQTRDLSAVISKSSTATTADAPDKRQQQPDSSSSTSTQAISVSADGNFDLVILFSIHSDDGNPSSVNIKKHYGRYSKSNKEVFSGEIVSLRSILCEIDIIDEDEEVASFRDKNSKSKVEGSRSRSQSMNEQSHYKQEKTRPEKAKTKSNQDNLNIRGDY
ncbi:hypothetical protein Tco_0534679 [Tanacetum coccineum]